MSEYPILECDTEPLTITVAQFLPRVSWSVKDACHPTWFFFWNPDGAVRLIFNGTEAVIRQEYAVLVPPGTNISAYSDVPFPHLYAHFKTGRIFHHVKTRPYYLPPETARKFFSGKKFQPPRWRSEIYWQILLWEYLMMLGPDAFRDPEQVRMDSRIAKAIRLCEEQVRNPPDNASLARSVGMSVNNFYRVFHQETGIPPTRYKNTLRLAAARKMLLETAARIPEIAENCGYADRYQFSKAFKKYFGMTPAAIRQSG